MAIIRRAAAALLLGTIVAASAALPAAAASGPAVAEAPDGKVTWAVTPADANGPDGRGWIEDELDPGEQVTEHLAVRNLGDQQVTFALKAADGYFTDTGRFNMLPSSEPSTKAGTWIAIQPDVTVEPGATAVVPLTITVPDNATPGDHAAGVAASVRSVGSDESGAQLGVESRVGFRVITRVTGELAPGAEVRGVQAEYTPSWNPFQPGRATITYTLANTGNVQFEYADRVGGAGATERGGLLPGEERRSVVEGVTVWPLFVVPVRLDVIMSGAEGAPVPDTISQDVTVWAIPWAQLAVLLGVLLIVLAVVTGRRRSKARVDRLVDEARAEGRAQAEADAEAEPRPHSATERA